MSESNGVFRVTRRSVKKFQFGDGEPEVTFDVIAVSDQWYEVSSAHRVLEGDRLIVQSTKFNEYAQARLNFVQSVVNDAYVAQCAGKVAPTLDRGEAEEFVKFVTEATDELRGFIFGKKDETLSPPTSTEAGQEINFSQ